MSSTAVAVRDETEVVEPPKEFVLHPVYNQMLHDGWTDPRFEPVER